MSTISLNGVLSYLRRSRPGEGDDGELLARFAAGDGAALEALVRRHAAMVWGVCRRMLSCPADAEDAFQATFLVLVRKARSLADGRPVAPWLHTVATRTATKARALALRRSARAVAATEPAVDAPDAALREARAVIDEEVRRLPAKYREAVMLCYLEGRTNEEAAKHLRCPKGTILSRLSRARDWLRRRLERRGLAPSVVGLGELFAPADVPVSAMTGAGRAGAASGGALALAEGVLTSMFLHQLKWVGAACLILVLGVAGAGWLAGARGDDKKAAAAATNGPETKAEEKKDAQPPEKPVDQPKKAEQVEPPLPPAPKEALAAKIAFIGQDDTRATLIEVLDQLARAHRVTFDFNERAFKIEMLNDVLKAEVAATPIPPMYTTLDVVLRKILSRVPVPSGAVYIVRKDRIEITTGAALRAELGLPKLKDGEDPADIVLVTRRLRQDRLQQALTDIGEETGENIILDPRAKKQGETELTLRLTNVPIDTALRLLADMASLEVVRMDNVHYVTTPDNAEKLRKKLAAEAGVSRHSTVTSKPGGM